MVFLLTGWMNCCNNYIKFLPLHMLLHGTQQAEWFVAIATFHWPHHIVTYSIQKVYTSLCDEAEDLSGTFMRFLSCMGQFISFLITQQAEWFVAIATFIWDIYEVSLLHGSVHVFSSPLTVWMICCNSYIYEVSLLYGSVHVVSFHPTGWMTCCNSYIHEVSLLYGSVHGFS